MNERTRSFWEANAVKIFVALASLCCAVGVGWLLISSKQPTPQETALAAILLTVFSTAASFLITKVYAEVAYSQTLRDHGVQIARNIILLQNQIERLANWVIEKREALAATGGRNHPSDATLEHVEQTLEGFQGMTDVALNGITQVIGDAWAQYQTIMEKMAKLRREESSEMTTIQEEIRTAPGDLVKAAELQSKMNLVALETEKQISELAKASPLPIFPPPKRSFSGDCPYCSASNLVEISDRSGETRSVVCHGCQNRFNVHLTAGRTFLVRPLPKTQVTGEARPFEKGVRQFLAQTDAWIEPAHLKGLIQITLDADRRLKEAAAIRTPASLLAKALEQEHQLQASSISRVMLRRFHKLLFMGRTFRFGEGATPGFKSVYTADLDENGLLHGFIAASVARASRHTPISHQEIPALARLLLPPEITDREQMIESAIEQLPKNFFDGE